MPVINIGPPKKQGPRVKRVFFGGKKEDDKDKEEDKEGPTRREEMDELHSWCRFE